MAKIELILLFGMVQSKEGWSVIEGLILQVDNQPGFASDRDTEQILKNCRKNSRKSDSLQSN